MKIDYSSPLRDLKKYELRTTILTDIINFNSIFIFGPELLLYR